jgi:hypothetical protein
VDSRTTQADRKSIPFDGVIAVPDDRACVAQEAARLYAPTAPRENPPSTAITLPVT